MKEEKKTGISGKIDKLQKQYNKILVDLFKENAEEAIEQAIEGTSGPIGGNISEIIQSALDSLRTIVENELGIAGEVSVTGVDMPCDGDGLGLGGIALEIGDDMDEEIEDEESENETDDEDETTEEEAEGDDTEDEKDEDDALEESFSTGSYLPSW